MSVEIGPARAYRANNSVGEPICLYGSGDGGYTVQAYFGKKGKLKGVTVWNSETEEFEAVVGKVPKGHDSE